MDDGERPRRRGDQFSKNPLAKAFNGAGGIEQRSRKLGKVALDAPTPSTTMRQRVVRLSKNAWLTTDDGKFAGDR